MTGRAMIAATAVVFNADLHMLREDTSPVKERLQSFKAGMLKLAFDACDNAIQACVVPAGRVTPIELNEKSWTIVRP